MKVLRLSVLIIGISLLSFGLAWAAGPWSLFGSAHPLKQGAKPNPWAIELLSTCPDNNTNCLEDVIFSGARFSPPNKRLTFRHIYRLSTSYKILEGDCGGGSPRFMIGLDTDGDGKVNGHILVYIGPPPTFTGCNIGVWENTGNLIDNNDTDVRFDINQLVPQTPRMSYKDTVEALGDLVNARVLYVLLVEDSGWLTDEVVLIDNVMVNNFRLAAKGFMKK